MSILNDFYDGVVVGTLFFPYLFSNRRLANSVIENVKARFRERNGYTWDDSGVGPFGIGVVLGKNSFPILLPVLCLYYLTSNLRSRTR